MESCGGFVELKEKGYINKVKEHADKILLVGICYDKKSKKHTCKIEEQKYMEL